MASPHGSQLAVHLSSSFYGDQCSVSRPRPPTQLTRLSPGTSCISIWFEICVLQRVCECLLRRGALTLTNIIRFTELSRENVGNCLRVLIHQNCVQAFAVQQEGSLLLCINLIGISDCKGRNCFITCFDPSVSVDEEKGFFATLFFGFSSLQISSNLFFLDLLMMCLTLKSLFVSR